MDVGSDFSNWNTATTKSSHTQQNISAEEDPSEESHHYESASENPEDYPFFNNTSGNSDHQSYNSESPVLYDPYMFPEPIYHGPFESYFQAPRGYQNTYNDIMVGLREPPPKNGYEHSMPSSPIECLDRSLRQTDEVTREKIMDKTRIKFYIQQNPSVSFHSAPTAGSYNVTPIYSQNFHEGYAEMPFENNLEEERADSNIPYVPTIPIPAPHVNENASGSEREQMLLNRIAQLEREKSEVEARNALLVQAPEDKNFRNF
ncbi:hypothetical protein L1987_06800 [Smallanthus sonchifolius]|uniref:Uncharacterized protein n=1 Tax=Smallanthus sonchifolius TaxID=185202 RepID=A0ACB9JZC1_9ASTR|nr:hypothetical protein L1987_06800 [Smallanthus sonchifolius]